MAVKAALDWFVFVPYFALHIVIAILIDSQIIFPASWYPSFAVEAVQKYTEVTNDFVLRDKPLWVQPFIYCEVLFQLPFFFAALYAYATKGNWIRIPAIIYGAHVATTVLPILVVSLLSTETSDYQKQLVAGAYLPFLIIPVLVTLRFALDPVPFQTGTKKVKKT